MYDKTGLETSQKQTFSYHFNRDKSYLNLAGTILNVLENSKCINSFNLNFYASICQEILALERSKEMESEKYKILTEFNSRRRQLGGTNRPKRTPLRVILLRKQIKDLTDEMQEVRQDRQFHVKNGQLTVDKTHLGYQDRFLKQSQRIKKQTTYFNEVRI